MIRSLTALTIWSLLPASALALQAGPETFAPSEAAPKAEPYDGTLTEGLAQVAALTLEDRYDESLGLSESLLAPNAFSAWYQEQRVDDSFMVPVLEFADPAWEWLGLLERPAAHRAEIHYARGVLLMRRGKHDDDANLRAASESEYQATRRLAGPGELRNSAVYNLGVGLLEEGERARLEIPEIREKLGLPELPPPPPPAIPTSPDEPAAQEPPDPLDIARSFYVQAREHLVERLKLDWRDEDTRANVELVQRRLRELDEIQQQREEQEQEQQDQEQDQENESEEKQEGEEPQDGEPQDESDENSDGEQESEQPPEEPEDEGEPEEPEEPEAGEESETEEGQDAEPQGEPEERVLTREEVMRLLEQLKDIEEEGQKVQEQMRDKRRVPVKRDW